MATRFAFAAAVALTVPVSLSITRPLRSLTRQAKDMADHRLPEAVTDILDTPLGEDVGVPEVAPVRVTTRDEVADVADALNTVQDSALDLAVEQAVLRRNIADSFVNLGRRNQKLLGRQLDFITELESRETDPDTLASLFRLDHLATRMRRNAESLLVLAGIEPPRQWAAPVRLTDVIRAALGEVENYQRVTVRRVEPATILGSAAADLAHLLAELIENALVFSPPDQTVDIRGAAQSSGQPGGYTLAVLDSGLGMPPADIAAANRRLAGAESFTIAPSKYLGPYVAGNLAARHDITVHLHSSPGTGITATVELPADLLTADPGTLAAPVAPRRGQRSLAERAPAPAAMSPTPGGLVPRAPRQPGVAPAGPIRAPASQTDAHMASLARAAARARAGQHPAAPAGPARAAPGVPWPGGQPFGQARAGTGTPWPPAHTGPDVGAPPPLTRRDRGAQMPMTTPHSVRRTPPADAALGGPSPSHPPRAALEIYGFLASFTAGVQRGLAATRTVHRDEPGR